MISELTLGFFLQALTHYQATGAEPAVSCLVVDSREVVPGSVFVALTGQKRDGHDYVADAFARGAVAAMVERPFPDFPQLDLRQNAPIPQPLPIPVCLLVADAVAAMQVVAQKWRDQFSTCVVGITGSVGKTTTKELVHGVLAQRFNTLKSPGNRNSVLGLPPVLLQFRPEHEYAVLEMAMYTQGEIARLCELARPTIGVVTMIAPVHLERAGSLEGIVAAKQELVEALPADGVAILNLDDARVIHMAAHTQARVFTYGLHHYANLWASDIHSMGLQGVHFTLNYQGEAVHLKIPLLGQHNVHTALRAAAVGLVAGLAWEEIVVGLTQTPAQLRLLTVLGPHNSLIIDDSYNASPDSVLAALNLLDDLNGRHVAVLGDMLELGYMEESSHRLVGRRVADVAQLLVAVGRRARWIAEEALHVGMSPLDVFMVEDAETAVSLLATHLRAQDIILVKGSLAMRMDRIVTALRQAASWHSH